MAQLAGRYTRMSMEDSTKTATEMMCIDAKDTTGMVSVDDTEDDGMEEGLVPFLPDDIALQCLLRVPVQAHSQLQGVCRKWRDLVNSREFYERRKKEGTTGHCICLLQAIPRTTENLDPHPSFNVSVLNERNLWERLPPIPGMEHESLPLFCRFAAVGGNLVVLGGWNPSTMEELRSVYIFSFSSRLWRRGADMPSARSFFSCAVLQGEILIAGGHDHNKTALRTADRYNFHGDFWSPLPSMHSERDECASVILHNKLYVLSGYSTSAQGDFRQDCELYDPDLNAWSLLPTLWSLVSKPVSPSTVVAAAGTLFAFRDTQLLYYSLKDDLWHVLDTIPQGSDTGISAAVCATAFNNSIVVTGLSNAEDGTHKTLVYRLPSAMEPGRDHSFRCRGQWVPVPIDEHFLGIAHVSCSVEV